MTEITLHYFSFATDYVSKRIKSLKFFLQKYQNSLAYLEVEKRIAVLEELP